VRPQKVLEGTTDKVIAVGASTGGTTALGHMIAEFPPNMAGTVVVQHMPPTFTRLFAERLDAAAAVEVKEAATGDRVLSGRVLIAPGGVHLEVIRSGGEYRVRCREGEKVNGHCPSVEVLFRSLVHSAGPNCVAVMLTGMGRDGAAAMVDLRRAGARTFAQDRESSIVYGMPYEAFRLGGAEKLVNLEDMTSSVVEALKEMS
jgi:two-component system chemotaxis response regulator CheB